ncbi:MAG: hypothetical protein ACOCXS_02625 [Bacteroidota bacterium]
MHEPETKKPAFKEKRNGVYQYAYAGNIKRNFFKIAKRIVDKEESRYYLRITLEDAREAGLTCDEFKLTESAVLIAQDLEGNLLTPLPYTQRDNLKKRYIKGTKKRMRGNVAGIYSLPNDFVLKLTINNNETDSCNIHLDQFLYSFKENEQKTIGKKEVMETKSTDPCDFGVMCMSNYTSWINEINSAVQIVLKYGVDLVFGSGVILNTTNNYNYDYSQHPFILTAAHLLDGPREEEVDIENMLYFSDVRPLEQTSCGYNSTPPMPAVCRNSQKQTTKPLGIAFAHSRQAKKKSINNIRGIYSLFLIERFLRKKKAVSLTYISPGQMRQSRMSPWVKKHKQNPP